MSVLLVSLLSHMQDQRREEGTRPRNHRCSLIHYLISLISKRIYIYSSIQEGGPSPELAHFTLVLSWIYANFRKFWHPWVLLLGCRHISICDQQNQARIRQKKSIFCIFSSHFRPLERLPFFSSLCVSMSMLQLLYHPSSLCLFALPIHMYIYFCFLAAPLPLPLLLSSFLRA